MNPLLAEVLQFIIACCARLLPVVRENSEAQVQAAKLIARLGEQKRLDWITHEFYLAGSSEGRYNKIGTKKTTSTEPWFPINGEYVMLSSGPHSEPFRIIETVHCDLGVTKHIVVRGWEDPEIKGLW